MVLDLTRVLRSRGLVLYTGPISNREGLSRRTSLRRLWEVGVSCGLGAWRGRLQVCGWEGLVAQVGVVT